MLARLQGASDHGQALLSSVLIWALWTLMLAYV